MELLQEQAENHGVEKYSPEELNEIEELVNQQEPEDTAIALKALKKRKQKPKN